MKASSVGISPWSTSGLITFQSAASQPIRRTFLASGALMENTGEKVPALGRGELVYYSFVRRPNSMRISPQQFIASFNSIAIIRMVEFPTFSTECGGKGSDQRIAPSANGACPRMSSRIVPRSSRRTKSLQLITCITAGQRWVCTGTISPGGINVWMTRTRSFSVNRV